MRGRKNIWLYHGVQPNEPTCPLIDDTLRLIDELRKENRGGTGDNYAAEIRKKMEILRTANGDLRDWGQMESDYADELLEKIEELEAELDKLRKD